VKLKFDPTRPIYIQIMKEIKKRAVREQYQSGAQLPSIRDMAKEMAVNPNTIARVYMELEREGFIVTRRGQGSFITDESGKIEGERRKLADEATERFINEIMDIELNGGHRGKLVDMISDKLSEKQRKKIE